MNFRIMNIFEVSAARKKSGSKKCPDILMEPEEMQRLSELALTVLHDSETPLTSDQLAEMLMPFFNKALPDSIYNPVLCYKVGDRAFHPSPLHETWFTVLYVEAEYMVVEFDDCYQMEFIHNLSPKDAKVNFPTSRNGFIAKRIELALSNLDDAYYKDGLWNTRPCLTQNMPSDKKNTANEGISTEIDIQESLILDLINQNIDTSNHPLMRNEIAARLLDKYPYLVPGPVYNPGDGYHVGQKVYHASPEYGIWFKVNSVDGNCIIVEFDNGEKARLLHQTPFNIFKPEFPVTKVKVLAERINPLLNSIKSKFDYQSNLNSQPNSATSMDSRHTVEKPKQAQKKSITRCKELSSDYQRSLFQTPNFKFLPHYRG